MRIALTGGIACGKSLVAKFLNESGVATIDADDIVHELLPDPAERRRLAAEVFADPEKRRALEAKLHPLVKERINSFLQLQLQTSTIEEGQGERSRSTVEVSNSSVEEGQGSKVKGQEEGQGEGQGERSRSTVEFSDSTLQLQTSTIEKGQRSKVKGQTMEFDHLCLTSDLGPLTSSLTSPQARIAIIPLLFETHWDAEYDIICCVRSARETQVARMMDTRGYTREEAEARLAAQLPVEEKAAKSHYVIENDGSTGELKSKVAQFVDWLKEKGVEV